MTTKATCPACKESLDGRDILTVNSTKYIHCWKCGTKQPLPEEDQEDSKYLDLYPDRYYFSDD